MNTLRRRIMAGLVSAFALLVAAALPGAALADTVLVIVRHADRDPGVDELNARGIARAQALVGALQNVAIDTIYIPDKNRNRQTAAPLAAARGIPVEVIPDSDLANRLLGPNEGKTILWIGNKDNLQPLWRSLQTGGEPPLEYGDLFIVTMGDRGPRSVKRYRFGN